MTDDHEHTTETGKTEQHDTTTDDRRTEQPSDHVRDPLEDDVSDDDEWADPSQGDVERDGEGEVIPQETVAGHLGKALVKPMPYGTVRKYFGDGSTHDLNPEDLAELFDEHYVKPNLSEHYGGHVGRKNVQYDMEPMTPQAYLRGLMTASGIEADKIEPTDDGGAHVEVSGNSTR